MFKICQGTCFCAANSDSGGGRGSQASETVLYCFGEVVLKKDSLRGEASPESKSFKHPAIDEYHLQLTQIVLLFIFFLLVLILLLLIRKGLLRVVILLRKLVRIISENHAGGAGGDTLRRDKEYLRKENG